MMSKAGNQLTFSNPYEAFKNIKCNGSSVGRSLLRPRKYYFCTSEIEIRNTEKMTKLNPQLNPCHANSLARRMFWLSHTEICMQNTDSISIIVSNIWWFLYLNFWNLPWTVFPELVAWHSWYIPPISAHLCTGRTWRILVTVASVQIHAKVCYPT